MLRSKSENELLSLIGLQLRQEMDDALPHEPVEKDGVYIDELDHENRQFLDQRNANIVRYAYPKEDKIHRIATAALIINRMIGGYIKLMEIVSASSCKSLGSGIFSTPSTVSSRVTPGTRLLFTNPC